MEKFKKIFEELSPAKQKSLNKKIYTILDSFNTMPFQRFAQDFKNNFGKNFSNRSTTVLSLISDADGVINTEIEEWEFDGKSYYKHIAKFYKYHSGTAILVTDHGDFKLFENDEAIGRTEYFIGKLDKKDISKIKMDIKRYNKLMKLLKGQEFDLSVFDKIQFPSAKEVKRANLETKLKKYYERKFSPLDVSVNYDKNKDIFRIDVSLQGIRRKTWGALFKMAKNYADEVIPELKKDGWKITQDYYNKYEKFWDDTEYSEYEMDAGIAKAEITGLKASKII